MKPTPHQLAEMLRIGSKGLKQCTHHTAVADGRAAHVWTIDLDTNEAIKNPNITAVCAAGAIYNALTPQSAKSFMIDPPLLALIINRNDSLRQSFTEIADWLDTL